MCKSSSFRSFGGATEEALMPLSFQLVWHIPTSETETECMDGETQGTAGQLHLTIKNK